MPSTRRSRCGHVLSTSPVEPDRVRNFQPEMHYNSGVFIGEVFRGMDAHFFGHCHEGAGEEIRNGIQFFNVAGNYREITI